MKKIKLLVTSDIHYHNESNLNWLEEISKSNKIDNLVIAGDLGDGNLFEDALFCLSEIFYNTHTNIYIICGNYDLWHDYKTINEMINFRYKQCIKYNVNFITNPIELEIFNLTWILAMNWYDYEIPDKLLSNDFYWNSKEIYNDDAKFIHFDSTFYDENPDITLSNKLATNIITALEKNKHKSVGIITHIPLNSIQTMYSTAVQKYGKVSPAYFINGKLGEYINKFSNIKKIIAGHIHNHQITIINNIEIITIFNEHYYSE